MRSYRGTRQFCDRWWCPTLDWRKESATIVHTSLMAGKSNNGVNKPGCPTVVCGPKKIGSCSYSVYSPSICPFEYPFLYNQLHQTFSYFTLFAPLTATPRAPSPSRLQSPLFMDPTNYPTLSLRLYQISWYCLQMFFRCIHCIYYPSTFSSQLLRWTKKLILLSFFLVPMVITKI